MYLFKMVLKTIMTFSMITSMVAADPVVEITGSYETAYEDYWIVEDVEDEYCDYPGNRQIQIRAWYPVDYQEEYGTAPIVIFSHGSGGTIDNNRSLYQELASHGYVVLAVGHTGHAATVTLSDGNKMSISSDFINEMTSNDPQHTPENTYEIFQKWMRVRMKDLNYVMDDIQDKSANKETYFAEISDATKFVMGGHSLGGSAAYAMARTRTDVVACFALESPFMYDMKGVENGEYIFDDEDYDIPLLNIYTDSTYAHLEQSPEYANNVKFLKSDNPNYTNIYYPGAKHMTICDLSIAMPPLANLLNGGKAEADPVETLTQLNSDCLNFIEKSLE